MRDEMRLHPDWFERLRAEFDQPYMGSLERFLAAQRKAGKRIFPRRSEGFRALDLTPLEKVRVVILGQDPYHGEGQAHGLCFSVAQGKITQTLRKIRKELERDPEVSPP